MPLAPGTVLGGYEILALLGAGGMGEVYRARDAKLRRDVALKILPEAFLADPDRVARFEREAHILAALNHPHIAGIYGLEEANSLRFLVLELVEGETLAGRIGAGRLGLRETLPIATEIVEALEAAHEKGVVHRDLKPANIALASDGRVKILDFGLAKHESSDVVASGRVDGLTHSPTLTFAATQAGVILGTAAYMSPEQAKGRPTDKRTDVWAFGCVLYEMLTGRRAFGGEDVPDTLAAILRADPDWNALPADTPSTVRRILRGCLEKDRRTRIPEIGVVRFLLDEPAQSALRVNTRRSAYLGAAFIVVAAIAAAAAWMLKPQTRAAPARTVRFALDASEPRPLSTASPYRDFVVSADGSRLVYSGYTGPTDSQLVIRNFDNLDKTVIPVQPATAPFESPDGKWLGYWTFAENALRKIPLTGGPSALVCPLSAVLRGASWGPTNRIVFATADLSTGLFSVSADGGAPTTLTTPDKTRGEIDHVFPNVLPSGEAVLFTITTGRALDESQIAVLDLKSGRYRTLIRGARQPEYVAGGYLLYAVATSLRAIRFDLSRLEVIGEPVTVASEVLTKTGGTMDFSTSPSGTLAYLPGRFAPLGTLGEPRSLVWVDRSGHEQAIDAPPRAYTYARLSPDGSRIALDIRDEEQGIWTYDIATGTLTRLTTAATQDVQPFWTPDGRRIVYTSAIDGPFNLLWQRADGSAPAERLTTSQVTQVPTSISHDGTRLFFTQPGSQTGSDLWTLRLDGRSRPEPLLVTPFNEQNADVSADGRWVVYQSNESQHVEVYVRPLPDLTSARLQVSNDGGERPMWTRSGREIFYMDTAGFLTGVAVSTNPTLHADRPRKVLQSRYFGGRSASGISGRTFDVTPDGQRFLMINEAPARQSTRAPNLVVVLNLAEDLRARFASAK
jgi:serine/threonine-protein kinase